MTDPEYMDRAEAALAAIERSCDRINDATDADVDNQRVGGMITITFAQRQPVDRQPAEAAAGNLAGGAFRRLPLPPRRPRMGRHQDPARNSSETCRARHRRRPGSRSRFAAD